MEKIGVAAVVEGLSGFMGDMDKIDDKIRKLISPTNILGSVFEGLGSIVSNLVGGALRTLEYALGTLIANAVMYVVTQIKELISNTIEAAGEFQKLELRLNTLNFNALTESGMDFNAATKESVRLTQEQLTWLQKLAATTPYDNEDISNTYTLARGYGFVDQEARDLTDTIVDFVSGMGLGNTEMVRIIKNFGQMRSMGKVMQRDLNDLATGAFVPVNEILAAMRLETGLAGDEFDKFRSSAEGVDSFMNHFAALVEGRFGGSAQKMARTFGAATDNMKDFIKSIFGLNVVKPILDVLGSRMADFMDELTTPERWDVIVGLANRMGDALSGVVSDLLGLAPDTKTMADKVVEAFENITAWVEENRPAITEFVRSAVIGFRDDLLPKIQQVWGFLFGSSGEPGAIQKFGAWLKDDFVPFIQQQVIPGVESLFDAITGVGKKPNSSGSPDERGQNKEEPTALENVASAVISLSSTLPIVLEIIGSIGKVITTAFGGDETQTFAQFVQETLIPALEGLNTFINENRDSLGFLLKALLALEVIAFIVGLVFSLVAAIATLVATAGTLAILGVIIGLVMAQFKLFQYIFTIGVGAFKLLLDSLVQKFNEWKANVTRVFDELGAAIKNKDWAAAGKAIIDGIWRGIKNNWNRIIDLARSLAQNALNAFNQVFNIHSPSVEMEKIGKNIVVGLAQGIETSSRMAIKQMSETASAVLAAASPRMAYSMATTGPSQNTYQTNNEFNLNMNSNASREPIIQDFGLMQSMVSA